MGRQERGQGQFFYAFDLDEVVPPDHLVRQIDTVLDLSWVHKELAPYYSHTGRPSIDPVLMIRMLMVGYVFAIRSTSWRADLSHTGTCGVILRSISHLSSLTAPVPSAEPTSSSTGSVIFTFAQVARS